MNLPTLPQGKTLAESINGLNQGLKEFSLVLPEGIQLLNPFQDNPEALEISAAFYNRFYQDDKPRRLILGINPGRLGAGATGIPFTDTKRFAEIMGDMSFKGIQTHEPSSVFVYEVIRAYGGASAFYHDFYINSVCPLGFTASLGSTRPVNYNYYDSKALTEAVLPLIRWNLKLQGDIAGRRDVCYCLGAGKNFDFLSKINETEHFFQRIVPLDHPRYVMQYKARNKGAYVQKWLDAFQEK